MKAIPRSRVEPQDEWGVWAFIAKLGDWLLAFAVMCYPYNWAHQPDVHQPIGHLILLVFATIGFYAAWRAIWRFK
jgi:hypothetical protein